MYRLDEILGGVYVILFVMFVMAFIMGIAMYVVSFPPPESNVPLEELRLITGAIMYTNESGTFLEVRLRLPEDTWVYGVALNKDLEIIRRYTSLSILLEKSQVFIVNNTLKAGEHLLVFYVAGNPSENPYIYFNKYPVRDNAVVVGRYLYPLSVFGVERDTEPRIIRERYDVRVYIYLDGAPARIINTTIDFSKLNTTLRKLMRANASDDEIGKFAKKIAIMVLDSMRNGSTVTTLPSTCGEPCSKRRPYQEIASELIDMKKLWVTVEIQASYKGIIKELVRNETTNLKSYLAIDRELRLEVDSRTMKPVFHDSANEIMVYIPTSKYTNEKLVVALIYKMPSAWRWTEAIEMRQVPNLNLLLYPQQS